MEDSLFTKIMQGEIPCHKVYEDEKTFAFLDIHPKQPGHLLVIPKQQVEFVWDLPDQAYQALMNTVQKLARHMRTVFGSKYVGSLVEGTAVPHAHVHLFPFNTESEFHARPDLSQEPDHDALAKIAEQLRVGL